MQEILLTGVLAAIMSTVSAQIIVAASAVAHDVVSKLMRKELDSRTLMLISRGTILVLGLGAMAVALMVPLTFFLPSRCRARR